MQDSDIALLIDGLMRRIHFGLQAQAPDFDRYQVGQGGGIVLLTLAETGPVGLSDLTRKLARDKSQMTRMIRVLEEKGLITRRPAPGDKRASLVALSLAGQEVVADLKQALSGVVGGLLSPLSPGEQAQLGDLLRRVLLAHP